LNTHGLDPLVLVVDDDPDILDAICDILQGEGYRVSRARHGLEALDKVNEERPTLILLDLMMPVMNGWDFRSHQLEEPELLSIPVVLLSGAGDVARHAVALKAAGYLIKPIRLDSLLRTVSRICAARASDGSG
jgi:CheY-like chemotaxis protein